MFIGSPPVGSPLLHGGAPHVLTFLSILSPRRFAWSSFSPQTMHPSRHRLRLVTISHLVFLFSFASFFRRRPSFVLRSKRGTRSAWTRRSVGEPWPYTMAWVRGSKEPRRPAAEAMTRELCYFGPKGAALQQFGLIGGLETIYKETAYHEGSVRAVAGGAQDRPSVWGRTTLRKIGKTLHRARKRIN